MPSTPSLAFARIRAEVLAATCAVPLGRVTTYGTIAAHLEVVPRHVAHVLSQLKEADAARVPWHRVVSQGGYLRSSSEAGVLRQRRRLEAEGVRVRKGQVLNFDELHFRWPERLDRPGVAARGAYAEPTTPPLFVESLDFGYPTPPAKLTSSSPASR